MAESLAVVVLASCVGAGLPVDEADESFAIELEFDVIEPELG